MKKTLLIITLILAILSPRAGLYAAQKRYISLAPSTTEILFALGLDEEIAGVSSYCNYPLKAKLKEKVGDFSRPNIEKIVSLRPDYIFCTGLEQAPVIAELRRLNLKVCVSDPVNLEGVFDSIREIGKITGRVNAAENLINNMQDEVQEVSSKVKLIPLEKRPKVFIEIWYDPLTTAGKGSFVNELLILAGGVNIAGDTRIPYSIFSPEEVIRRNPDCIIFAYMDPKKPQKLLEGRLGWRGISAVKNNRLYNDINPDILLRPSPRIVLGIKEIHRRLYLKDEPVN